MIGQRGDRRRTPRPRHDRPPGSRPRRPHTLRHLRASHHRIHLGRTRLRRPAPQIAKPPHGAGPLDHRQVDPVAGKLGAVPCPRRPRPRRADHRPRRARHLGEMEAPTMPTGPPRTTGRHLAERLQCPYDNTTSPRRTWARWPRTMMTVDELPGHLRALHRLGHHQEQLAASTDTPSAQTPLPPDPRMAGLDPAPRLRSNA